jgi:hypothetical protein
VSDTSGTEIKAMSRLVRVFPARIDALAHLAAFVEEVAALAEFTRPDRLRLTLVLEGCSRTPWSTVRRR